MFIHAAAGYGKTSVLAQWRMEALRAGSVAAWLTLDSLDNDSRLVRGLVASMRAGSGRPNFGQAALRATESGQGTSEAMTVWLAEVADMATDTLLLLDDVHELPESTVTSSLGYLLLNAPSNLKIVLAARQPLALPIFDLIARGRFVALTAADLCFHQAETVALLSARFGPQIDQDSCARLHQLTEGWPLGVELAVSTIERSPNMHEAIARFSVQSSDIQRYFVGCLVDQLPPVLAQFLVCISFVDAVSPSLSEAISGRENSVAMLAELCERTPIFAEGLNSVWLRIHPLARQFLQERFDQLPESDRRAYYARAGRWLAGHNAYEEAARHMLKAGQTDLAYELIDRSLHELMDKGQVSQVLEWSKRLPWGEIERRTGLRLTVGWLLAQSERHAEAINLVGSIIEDASADPVDRCESAEICAAAAFFSDDIDRMKAFVSSWDDAMQSHSAQIRLVGVNMLATMMLFRGAPGQARYGYTKVSWDDSTAGRYALGWRDWIIGISYIWEGHVELARHQLHCALRHAENESGRRSPIAVMIASALAATLLECNLADEATALLADRLDVLERRTPPDAIAMGFVTSVRIAAINGEEPRAFDLLDFLYALGQARGLPRLCITSLGEQIRLHAFRGRGDVCVISERKLDAFVAALGERAWGALEPVVELQIGLAHVYSAIARQDWTRALDRLSAISPVAERISRGREIVQIFLLKALVKKRCGEDSSQLLHEALGMARLWGFARIVEDTHPHLVDWAQQVRGAQETGSGLRDRDASLQANSLLPEKSAASLRVKVAGSSLLSPKEQEVLQLLAGNMSNKQIALAMAVSDETIKWHLKNLFGKLYAGNRKHLLDRARIMGILDTGT